MSQETEPKGSVAALLRYWRSLAGGAAPQRSDIDPAAIKLLLPYLYIVRYETGPFRVRYVLTGTETDRWNGFSLTGRYIDEFLSADKYGANRHLLGCYIRAYETGAPVFGTYDWPTRAGTMLEVRFGMFPLRVGESIAQCLAIEDYSGFPPAIAADGIPFEDPAKAAPNSN
ncbi:PAS domain-containing protein [Dongia sp.]|uniref:PAS domain-containing protein n=1 Tax=Dongia sp. TaxID=1977262 RepID=UPI0035B25026